MEYIVILAWIGFMALIARSLHFKRTVLADGIEQEKYTLFFAILIILPVVVMAGFRSEWFADTRYYKSSFMDMPDSLSRISDYLSTQTKDKGFAVFSIIIKTIIGDNFHLYFLIIAVIQGIAILKLFRNYSCSYIISIFLFIASTDYLSWMYNGIRQFLAVTIILFAVPWIIKKKYIPSIIVILLASTIHQSALLMIPIIFIVQGEAWNKKTITIILLALLVIVSVGTFTTLLDSALSDTQYKNVVTDYTALKDDGTNPLRVIVYSIPAIISFFGRKKIRGTNDVVINISTNMSIISSGLYIVSMITSGLFLGRLPIYCSLFSYILLPWEIENVFDVKSRSYIYAAMVILYLAFYYFQVHVIWGLI